MRALHIVGNSLVRSIFIAVAGATALTALGFFVGYVIHTGALSISRAVDGGIVLLFALPGTVIGMGLIALWNHPRPIYLRYATYHPVRLPRSIHGANWSGYRRWSCACSRIDGRTGRDIRGKLAATDRPHRAAVDETCANVGLVDCIHLLLRDTGITMLVYPPGYDTLPVRIFTLMANGAPPLIAAACVLMVAATVLPLFVVAFLMGTQRRRAWR